MNRGRRQSGILQADGALLLTKDTLPSRQACVGGQTRQQIGGVKELLMGTRLLRLMIERQGLNISKRKNRRCSRSAARSRRQVRCIFVTAVYSA